MRLPTISINFDRLWQSLNKYVEKARERRRAFFRATLEIFSIIWLRGLKPFGLTGINILGYLLDKLLLGAPGLRAYLGDTVILAHWDFQKSFQTWVLENAGWNIYASLSGPLDNMLGVLLGLGLGLVNYLTHALSSVFHNIRVSFNILGEFGVFGKQRTPNDNRPLAVKFIFGLLTLPLALPLSFVINLLDIALTTIKHLSLSFIRNLRFSYNLLDLDAHLTSKNQYHDNRHPLVRGFFGALTLMPVAVIASLTNSFFLGYTLIRNTGLSLVRNIKASYNLLGIHGIFRKEQASLLDNRRSAVKVLFGIVSAPLVFPVILATNGFNALLTSVKHLAISWYENVRIYFNLLGKNGVFGEARTDDDTRHVAVRLIFDLLASPLILATIAITNSLDLIATTAYHYGLSLYRNLSATYNLLGKEGVFGERSPFYDDRSSLTIKIIFGILSSPIVAIASLTTNSFNGLFTFVKHLGLSTWMNLKNSYNLLGRHGVYGIRKHYEDPRPLAVRLIFGLLSAPLVILPLIASNVTNLLATNFSHLGLSFWENLRVCYNLLGDHGVLGPRRPYDDQRPALLKILFGIVTAPLVGLAASLSNSFDLVFTGIYHTAQSISLNIQNSYNLLGKHGVYGEKRSVPDNRHLALRLIFGFVSLPIVALPFLVSNAVNLVSTGLLHFEESILRGLHKTCNLLLGQHGIFKKLPEPIADTRHPVIKYTFLIPSLPIIISLAFVANILDLVLTGSNHWLTSAYQIIRAHYNLLGIQGSFGARKENVDTRPIALKVVFGLLSIPLVILPIALTNTLDLALTTIKHTWISFVRNIKVSWNLLGRYGCFGEMTDYKDDRHIAARLLFGLLSLPAVVALSVPWNAINLALTLIIGIFDSLVDNVKPFYNLLGSHGSFGERGAYDDTRTIGERIIFGILSAPLVIPIILTTNTIDLLWTGLNRTIFNKEVMLPLSIFLVGTVIVLTTGLPVLLARKALKGAYNLIIRPFMNGFEGRIFLSGLLNVTTLGLFGLGKKLFKSFTGYSNRFGLPNKEMDETNANLMYQETFRKVIDMTKSGELPSHDPKNPTPRDHSFRPILRFFYGVRAEEETVAKRYHSNILENENLDTYLETISPSNDIESDVKMALAAK